jgi:hypothetical protein
VPYLRDVSVEEKAMLERYFKRGAIFRWQRPRNPMVPPDGSLVDKQTRSTPMTYIGTAADMGFSGHVDPTFDNAYRAAQGMTPGLVIRYKWLDYQAGRTVRTPIRTRPILTGPMSGCPIVRWTDAASGVTYVGHVGTIYGQPTVTQLVKQSIQPLLPATATGFSPANAWTQAAISANIVPGAPFASPEVCAFVTLNGDFYATVFYSVAGQSDAKYCGGSIRVTAAQGPALNALL